MLALMPRCLAIILVSLVALVTAAPAQPYGLDSRPSFAAFNNGALPPNASTISGTWSAVPVANWPTFSNPMGIVQEPGTQSMIVWEREGRVYRFDKATGTGKTLMLDLSSNTQGWDDCGMLNLICHPNYATNKYVFIYYVWQPGASSIKGSSTARPPTFMTNWKRLSRFTVKPDGTIDKASETVLVHQKCQALWHSGSGMFFHPNDGFLYFINGDDFVPSKAQKLDGGIFSGIFRIDVDQRGGAISHAIPRQPLPGPNDNTGSYTANYSIPNDNPLVGQSGVLEEYFALGVRSPHRLTYDAVTGRMFHSDVGDESREEINVVEPGEVLPNYQWPRFEGLVGDMTQPYLGLNKKPIIDYAHTDGSAVIGGYVYRGNEFPELKGKYIFGDNMNGTIWYLDESTTPATKVPICKLTNGPGFNAGDNYLGLSSFGVDADGELYMVQLSTSGGRIYKLSRTGGNTNQMPATLSATNLFSDLANLTANTGFIAYDVITPLWSDGAEKKRWFAVPSGQRIGYAPTGEWSFPTGSVFVKHFDLPTDETNPTIKRRLETRVIVRDNQGFVYGGTYKWRNDLSDADLVTDTQTEAITITTASGTRSQTWTFPGRSACLQCHTPASKGVLGLSTPQNHRDHLFTETGITDNQLRAWNHVGYFTPAIDEGSLGSLAKFAAIDDSGASVETRVRSYLDSNCSHCHRPGGVRANWDARFEVPLANAGIIDGSALNDLGTSGAQVVTPGSLALSVLHKRISTASQNYAMPPIAKDLVDAPAVALIEQWINALPTSPDKPPSIAGTYLRFGGNWGAGGLTASPAGDKVTLVHQTAPPNTPSDPKPETPASWYGMELKGDGYLMARVTHYPSDFTQMGLMVRSSLADGAGGIGGIYGPVTQPPNSYPPPWMLIGYSGTTFTIATSSDGNSWSRATSAGRPAKIYLGMWLSAGSSGAVQPSQSASFDHIRFFPTVPWAITNHPSSQLVRVGDLVDFGVETVGLSPTSYQWRKSGQPISRAVSARYAFKAALTSAGSFNVLTGGKLASNAANLVVLDKVTYTNNLAPNTTATFTLSYAGTGATFTWTKDGVPLQNSTRIVGANTAKLSVKSLTLADIGDYECVVTGFGSTQVLGPCHLHVLSKPAITASAPLGWSVSRAFTWQLSADEPVSSYAVGGLPSGLSCNATTGVVSGTPNVGGSFTITVSARNAAGTGATRSYTLNVEAFPSLLVGSFAGLLDRDAANGQLGGTLSLTLSSNGAASGKLVFGTGSYSLNNRAVFISGSDPTLDLTIKRTGTTDLVLHLALNAGGTISGNANGVLMSARRLVASAGSHVGTYYAALDPVAPGNVLQPQGSGWARFIVSANGSVAIGGRMAENAAITASATLRDDGSIAWHQTLYNNKGSVRGTPAFAVGAVTGGLDWQKTGSAGSTDRTYASGFPLMSLAVDGLKFAAPAPSVTFLGNASAAGNARIEFMHGGIEAAAGAPINVPDQTFQLTAAHKAIFDGAATNPCRDTLTITPTTGYFIGTMTLKDGVVSRTATYQGVFLPGRSQARGAFRMRQLPNGSADPVLSGAVLVKAWP